MHYLVELRSAGNNLGALGRLDVAHLADHPAAEAALIEAIVVGSDLGPLLVLERLEVSPCYSAACMCRAKDANGCGENACSALFTVQQNG